MFLTVFSYPLEFLFLLAGQNQLRVFRLVCLNVLLRYPVTFSVICFLLLLGRLSIYSPKIEIFHRVRVCWGWGLMRGHDPPLLRNPVPHTHSRRSNKQWSRGAQIPV